VGFSRGVELSMAKIIRSSELIISETTVPSIAGSRKQPQGSTGAGDTVSSAPPSHQTYFRVFRGLSQGKCILITPGDGVLWRHLDKRAKQL